MLSRLSSTIINQVEAMREMVDAFRLYASEKSGRSERMDLGAMAAELAGLVRAAGADDSPPLCGKHSADSRRRGGAAAGAA